MKVIKSKEFWIGAISVTIIIKWGDKIPVVGGAVARAKAAL
jgi:hypothetical protein